FVAEQDLPYTLASDESHEVMTAYGAWGEKNMYGKIVQGTIRSTFAIDAEGVLTFVKYRVGTPKHIALLQEKLALWAERAGAAARVGRDPRAPALEHPDRYRVLYRRAARSGTRRRGRAAECAPLLRESATPIASAVPILSSPPPSRPPARGDTVGEGPSSSPAPCRSGAAAAPRLTPPAARSIPVRRTPADRGRAPPAACVRRCAAGRPAPAASRAARP